MSVYRCRIYIIIGSILVVAGLLLVSYYRPFHNIRIAKKFERVEESWEMQTYVSLTNTESVRFSLDTLVESATNIHLIGSRTANALKDQIHNALLAYSTGDYDNYVSFRMPCGYNVNIDFVRSELNNYINDNMYKWRHPDDSTEASGVIWKRMLSVASEIIIASNGDNGIWCAQCWEGFSPDQSWVKISNLPIPMDGIESDEFIEINKIEPDLILSPPDIHGNISTPKLYAAVKLHVDIGKHYLLPDKKSNHHPVYIIFALTTNPECWIPVEFAVGASWYYDYMF